MAARAVRPLLLCVLLLLLLLLVEMKSSRGRQLQHLPQLRVDCFCCVSSLPPSLTLPWSCSPRCATWLQVWQLRPGKGQWLLRRPQWWLTLPRPLQLRRCTRQAWCC